MKKLMFAALAALAMVGAANAAQSYGIMGGGWVAPYATYDTDPGDGHADWYNFYIMKQEDAQKAMGTTASVTYSDVATWLGKNFADNKQSVIDNAEHRLYYQYAEQYAFFLKGNSGSGLMSAIGVFFYDDGKNVAYDVMANTMDNTFLFDDYNNSSPNTGWVAVPEPTSGLLLLLGVAGLALKRKRA